MLEPPLDVLHHHDRVVHHDADRQHQAEQREVIEAEAQRGHDGERADDRHRHGHQRNERRPPVLEEDQHDDRHQDHRVAQGLEDLVDRLADEGRGVVDDLVVQPVREPLLELLHLGVDAVGGLEGVGAGKLKDRQRHRGLAVEGARLVVLLRAELDAGHVAQPDDADGLRQRRPWMSRRWRTAWPVRPTYAGAGDGRLRELGRPAPP